MAPALQISIPETSVAPSPQGKPYTQYHIILQLPLRRDEIKKRYSDFVQLNQDLTSQSGTPPATLPAKNWFSRTVNNDPLTEQRRVGLERYLQAIIAADDGRWRSSKAWRAFMNLPEGTSTIDSRGNLSSTTISSGNIDSSQWLDMHRQLKTTIQTIRQQLKQREAATSVQQQHALSAEVKASLVRATGTIQQLDTALSEPNARGGLGDGEQRRRKDLIVAARKEVQGLNGILKTSLQKPAAEPADVSKDALWKGTTAGKGRVLGPAKETERTRELDNKGVLQLQQQIMQEQDEDVESLAKTVNKLKDMGVMINEELIIQNEMLGLVEQDADRLQGKIDVGRSRIKKIR
ncbi:hypothetical protein AMS68_001583 [Peltaster fructicola]|uniref:t-SNARE coiled-coil homology domain-containing protein n=1 Tax=Peltaster fructicola TaxID=286661 RepID=A0A6H0XMY5_9PEZI|nr:hypothetical protein AMS68_001583 [Peltaster fructicola]